MQLPIKKKYFDEIKSGRKMWEFRDAHITFVCEETGERIRKNVVKASVTDGIREHYPDVLEDELTIVFELR